MEINSQNAKKIDSYIKDFQKICVKDDFEKVRIQDKIIKLPVYRIPLDYLYYNVANGRFAKEYLNKKKELKRELQSENPADVVEIENMLRNQNPSKTIWLKENIIEMGQEEPGIITHDGYVINGNRRMSVLSLLAKEDSKYGYMNVGRLLANVSESDIYKIELGKQMAREQKLDYGPINELLKIEHGITSGLNSEQIAKTIGFSKEEIEEKIQRLDLIREYLDFIGEPDNFEAVENVNEHFIDLRTYVFSEKAKKKHQFSPLEELGIKEIAFAAISAKIPHLPLRKIPRMLKNEKIKPIFLGAKDYAYVDHKKTRETFEICETRLKAEEGKDKPGNILEAILGNLEALDFDHPRLKTDEFKTVVKKILRYTDELKKIA